MASISDIWINLNGQLTPGSEAKISPLDHGFLYGDSVYETARTFGRRPFLLGRHLDRLERSMERLLLEFPDTREALEGEILRSIAEVPFEGEVVARVVISRGVGPLGLAIDLCKDPSFLIYLVELGPESVPDVAHADGPDGGMKAVVSSVRRNSPNALDPSIKSGNFLNNILAYRDAREAGAFEAILCGADGFLAEGTTSNVFVVKDGVLRTPLTLGILDGITRAVILEEAGRAGIEHEEANIPPEDLSTADEVFISSSVRGLVPMTQIGDTPVGNGKKGDITRRLQALYQARLELECAP